MKKVRIIADDHVACTISLAKAFILSGCHVQYVYVTATASLNNLEGINIKATLKYGVNDLTEHLKGYIDDKSFTFIVYRYPRPFESVKFINKIANVFIKIHSYLYRKFWEEKFDLINVVGRYSSNMYIYLMDYFPIDKTLYSIHEVYNHFTKQIPDHPFINKLISNNYKIILHSQNSIFDWNYCFREYKSKIYNVNFGKCDSYNVCIQNPVVDENGYILFFGFFKAYKGLNNILEMLKKYEGSRSFRFVIAGAGTLPEVDDLSNFDNVCIINR